MSARITAPVPAQDVGGILAPLDGFWEHWGFEPWSDGSLRGVSRLQRFVKDGFLGRIAEYRAWDCIVWEAGTADDRERIWKTARPMPDVMTQRFVFLLDQSWPKRRIRSFAFGFRGYLEFFGYRPAHPGSECAGARDLTDLVDMGMRLAMNGEGV